MEHAVALVGSRRLGLELIAVGVRAVVGYGILAEKHDRGPWPRSYRVSPHRRLRGDTGSIVQPDSRCSPVNVGCAIGHEAVRRCLWAPRAGVLRSCHLDILARYGSLSIMARPGSRLYLSAGTWKGLDATPARVRRPQSLAQDSYKRPSLVLPVVKDLWSAGSH